MSAGASLVQTTLPHTINVVVHVAFGTVALLVGLVPLVARKGGRAHVKYGRWFLRLLAVVIATAVAGIVFFGFRAFLGVITLLAAYEAYSGYRALQIRFTGPTWYDGLISLAAIVASVLLLAYLRSVHLPWSPAVIYPTLGSLSAVSSYDLARFAFPKRWYGRTWFYEHLVKMLGAYTAVVSAFSGTVLERWQPYSQILPSALSVAVMVGFIVHFRRRPLTSVQSARLSAASAQTGAA